MKYIILVLSTVFILNSCLVGKSSKSLTKIMSETESIAKNNFKSDYTIKYSKSYDFAAVTKKIKLSPNDDFNTLKIMVYDTKNKKIIWGRKAIKGNLEWTSKSKFKLKFFTKENKKKVIIFDAETKVATEL